MIAGYQSRRAFVAAGILLAHVAALSWLATLGPRMKSAEVIAPIAVSFVAEALPPPQRQLPEVRIVTPAVIAPMPELALIEIPAAPASDRAITLPTPPPERSNGPAQPSTPKLVTSVEYLREPSPRYPPQSRRLREQGLVVLRVVIDERGVACDIQIENSSGYARLDHAARDAVERAAFRPYIEDGMPRRALVLIPIEFSLNRSTA